MTRKQQRPLFAAFAVILVAAVILWLMGRPPICTCGEIDLWVNSAASPRTSQMLADWYAPSHILHGIIFYALLTWAFRRWSVQRRFLAATLMEVAWEIVENSPIIIDRYREATAAVGYTGDSILNSVSDIAMMGIGFFLARKLPIWAILGLIVALEVIPLLIIRDNLSLNVLMLLAPDPAIKAWQAGPPLLSF
ncbi:DUF2585 family protein [Sphingomonas arenae]|uniref:DUF2585 family protein n=1 Tax=Sphingomonas arenae TaxID=2812555 RepID=UPI001967445F|nr:DUF2585 family protein [Sphingomonas arenae]